LEGIRKNKFQPQNPLVFFEDWRIYKGSQASRKELKDKVEVA
jgi:hypothetical protein